MSARFIQSEASLELPCWRTSARLLDAGGDWLAGLARAACVDGHTLRVRVGPGEAAALRKEFDIDVGTIHEVGSGLVVPTVWRATGPRALFPVLDAELRVAPTDQGHTLLCLDGHYTVPLGQFGDRLAGFMLHRVVQTSVDAFLDRLATALGGTGRSGPNGPEGSSAEPGS
jgi:hypothetical protein